MKVLAKVVSDFQNMLLDETFTDFQLKTNDGEVLKAHKVVLATRSPVFHAMLTKDMQEAREGCANVPDFDSKIMKEILRFIYCHDVGSGDEIARDLIYAAEKYQLDELKKICLASIIKLLSIENVVGALMISDQVSEAVYLNEKCLDLIIR